MQDKERIAKRAAKEVLAGQVINLGIGIPTLIKKYLPDGQRILVQSENGILGMGNVCEPGTENRNLVDAGAAYVTAEKGAKLFDSATSFAMIRGGRIDITFLGTLEVSEKGDLANWTIPGKTTPGIGGGMELAQKAKKVIVTTTHCNKSGSAKILPECTYPLTAKGCVSKIITELAVIDITPDGAVLSELAEGVTKEEVVEKTACKLRVPEGELKRF